MATSVGEAFRKQTVEKPGNSKVSRIYQILFSPNEPTFAEQMDELADLIASYSLITRTTHFVLVPGPLDIAVNSALPRWPILSSFATRLKARVPKLYFGTNPCRIRFFEQEIVIFRENLMARMLRNLVGVKPNVHTDDLKRYVSVPRFMLLVD